jgi:hypothetical protein
MFTVILATRIQQNRFNKIDSHNNTSIESSGRVVGKWEVGPNFAHWPVCRLCPGTMPIRIDERKPKPSFTGGSARCYLRGRCFSEIERMISLPLPALTNGGSACASATSSNCRTSGLLRVATPSSLTNRF